MSPDQEHARYPDFVAETIHQQFVLVPSGAFTMGSTGSGAAANEQPTGKVTLSRYFIARQPVTNEQYELFDPSHRSKRLVKADKRHPVVYVSSLEAIKFCQWLSSRERKRYRLPTEAEWEFAARGGLDAAEYAWGDQLEPGGKQMANTWQGEFPIQNALSDGFETTSPVGSFPPNGYGLHDMIGNVWEWTTDWWSAKHEADGAKACCIPQNPRGGPEGASYDSCQPNIKIARKVLKGGSHLCAPNYCRRYRPAARHAEPIDTSTCHLGFRCIKRERTEA
jgi:formylglycine-generating enzyme required for sulfatase activity